MNYKKLIIDFIDSIPDEKLDGFKLTPGTVYKDNNFRLNMQGLTSSTKEYNLQIQVNFKCKASSLKGLAPNTIAGPVFVAQPFISTSKIENANRNGVAQEDVGNKSNDADAESDTPDPDAIREAFKASIKTLKQILGPGENGPQGKNGDRN